MYVLTKQRNVSKVEFENKTNLNFKNYNENYNNLEKEKNYDVTFKTIANQWLKSRRRLLSKSSYEVYKCTVYKYFISEFGMFTLDEIENYNYNEFVERVSSELEPKTARDIITKLKSILCYAEDHYDINIKVRIRNIALPQLQN